MKTDDLLLSRSEAIDLLGENILSLIAIMKFFYDGPLENEYYFAGLYLGRKLWIKGL